MSETTIETVSLDSLTIDAAIQQRENGLSETVLAEYRATLDQSPDWPFDPITVFRGPDGQIVADGFHRCAAASHTGRRSIPAAIIQGTRRDALLFAVGANAKHGLQRTAADKRRAVLTLLRDAEWSGSSDRWIAEKARVSRPFVAKVRAEFNESQQPDWSKSDHVAALPPGQKVTNPVSTGHVAALSPADPPQRRTGKDGKTYPVAPRTAQDQAAANEQAPAKPRKRSGTASTESAPIPTERRTPQDPSPGKLVADFLLGTGAKIRYLNDNRAAVERYPDTAPQLVLAMEEALTWLRPLVAHRLDSSDQAGMEDSSND